MAILRDGLIGTGDYPANQPALTAPSRPEPEVSWSGIDRVHYVLNLRPLLVAGGLIETDEMKKETAAILRQVARDAKQAKALPAATSKRLPNGDYVPIDWLAEGEVSPEAAKPIRDYKAAASGERQETGSDSPF